MSEFVLRLAGVNILCRTRWDDTVNYFRSFGEVVSDSCYGSGHPAGDRDVPADLCAWIPDRDWMEYIADNMEDCAHTEYSMLTPHFCDVLLAYDRVILHGVAVRWKDKAYLICASSGTGKTTQARTLQAFRPGEFSIICGDRPVLEFRPADSAAIAADQVASAAKKPDEQCSSLRKFPGSAATPAASDAWSILVHPSPWNGKENLGRGPAAPLAGIILLERGEENRLVSLTDKEAALLMYPHFIQTAWEADKIRKVAELETRLLSSVPIWKLTTFQVPDSTRLLLESVFSES